MKTKKPSKAKDAVQNSKIMNFKEEISALEKEICSGDLEQANKLGKLVKLYQEQDSSENKLVILHALNRTFAHIIDRGDFDLLEEADISEMQNESKALLTYVRWLQNQYRIFIQETFNSMEQFAVQHQVAIVRTGMFLIARDEVNHLEILGALLSQLVCSSTRIDEQVLKVLKEEYLEVFLDIRYKTCECLTKLAKLKLDCLKKNNQQDDDDDDDDEDEDDDNRTEMKPSDGTEIKTTTSGIKFVNAEALELCSIESFCQHFYEILNCIEGRKVSSEEAKDKASYLQGSVTPSKKKVKKIGPKGHAKRFQDVWVAYVQLPLSTEMYRKVLSSLSTDVMPFLKSPLLMADFLTASYSVGGITSLLSLNGLWMLMSKHGLDYPQFYERLYNLLEPELFFAEHRSKFFELLDLFMTSTHISSHLVAAFAKKMARLSLRAPPSGCIYVIVFIHNLLKRHPACLVLVDRDTGTDPEEERKRKVAKIRERSKLLALGKAVPEDGPNEKPEFDPFIMEETDPLKSNALQSSLWEIETLNQHYVAEVSTLVKSLFTDELKKMILTRKIEPPIPVAEFTKLSYSTLFSRSMKRKRPVEA